MWRLDWDVVEQTHDTLETCPADGDKHIVADSDQNKTERDNSNEIKDGSETVCKTDISEGVATVKEENEVVDNSDGGFEAKPIIEATEKNVNTEENASTVIKSEDQPVQELEQNGVENTNSESKPDVNGTSNVNGIHSDEVKVGDKNGLDGDIQPETSEKHPTDMAETSMQEDDSKEKQVRYF